MRHARSFFSAGSQKNWVKTGRPCACAEAATLAKPYRECLLNTETKSHESLPRLLEPRTIQAPGAFTLHCSGVCIPLLPSAKAPHTEKGSSQLCNAWCVTPHIIAFSAGFLEKRVS